MPRDYHTRQKALVLEALKNFAPRAVTAEELMTCLRAEGERVGKATVYRQLERLLALGKARALPGHSGTLYLYVDDDSACQRHLHCQCIRCGRFFHVECGCLGTLSDHLRGAHQFVLDPGRTVLQGTCDRCRKEETYAAVDP